jgi:hypothetical protein
LKITSTILSIISSDRNALLRQVARRATERSPYATAPPILSSDVERTVIEERVSAGLF